MHAHAAGAQFAIVVPTVRSPPGKIQRHPQRQPVPTPRLRTVSALLDHHIRPEPVSPGKVRGGRQDKARAASRRNGRYREFDFGDVGSLQPALARSDLPRRRVHLSGEQPVLLGAKRVGFIEEELLWASCNSRAEEGWV